MMLIFTRRFTVGMFRLTTGTRFATIFTGTTSTTLPAGTTRLSTTTTTFVAVLFSFSSFAISSLYDQSNGHNNET
uniref:Uncharacterized protein n=1 Tax=Babesia bovis TaxID=5865 RepID=S6BL06_BABBO|nr:hypothetical protein [Babesia bovis]